MANIFFEQDDIQISNSIARFGNTSYPIANIGAVTLEEKPSALPGLGILVILAGVVWIFSNQFAGIATIVVGALAVWKGNKISIAKIILRTSSGNEQAFESRNKDLVIEIKTAIENAIAENS